MLEGLCRNTYEKAVISPLLKIPAVHQCNPIMITIIGCLVGISFAPLIILGWKWTAIGALFASGFLDTLDGSVSRFQNSVSAKGAVWDIVCDRVVECSVLLGLFCVNPAQRGLLTIGMMGSCLLCVTSFLVVGIFSENIHRVIQKLEFGKAGARNLGQASAVAEADHVNTHGRYRQDQSLGCQQSQNQFLNHDVYTSSGVKKSFHYSPGLIERAEAFLFWGAMALAPYAFAPLSWTFIVLVLMTTAVRLFQFTKHAA